jgi:hypothetical protein
MQTSFKTITATALIGIGTLSLSLPANAGWGCGWGCGWGSAIAGFGVGALVGSALAAPPVYVVPPPPPDYYYSYYYGPADYGYYYYAPPTDYGPPPRTPSWHGTRPHPHSKAPSHAAVPPMAKTSGSEQKIETKFAAAQARAKRDGVDALTKEDIDGLSSEQLKQLRGY